MSLVSCASELEEGVYGNFNFALKIIYDLDNLPKRGILYLRERGNLIKNVELPVEFVSEGTEEKVMKIDFKPLEISAIKGVGGPYLIEDMDGLLREISRKYELIESRRKNKP